MWWWVGQSGGGWISHCGCGRVSQCGGGRLSDGASVSVVVGESVWLWAGQCGGGRLSDGASVSVVVGESVWLWAGQCGGGRLSDGASVSVVVGESVWLWAGQCGFARLSGRLTRTLSHKKYLRQMTLVDTNMYSAVCRWCFPGARYHQLDKTNSWRRCPSHVSMPINTQSHSPFSYFNSMRFNSNTKSE